jgi:hypothetical protein
MQTEKYIETKSCVFLPSLTEVTRTDALAAKVAAASRDQFDEHRPVVVGSSIVADGCRNSP